MRQLMARAASLKAAALLAVALAGGTATAAGPYDGIYHVAGTQEYYSVHQAGNQLIVGNFITQPFDVRVTTATGQQFNAARLDYWNLFSGSITGASARLRGEAVFGACQLALAVTFTTGGGTVAFESVTATAQGKAQGIDCPGAFAHIGAGGSFSVVKVF